MTSRVLGSWMGDKSFVFKCRNPCKTLNDIKRCISGTHWHFIGDSTVRQIARNLDCLLRRPNCTDFYDLPSPPVFYPEYNSSVRFHFHGFPIRTSKATFKNFSRHAIPFSAETIDAIPGSNTDIIVIGSIQHFVYIPFPGFVKRIEATRDALLRLRKRAPGATIIWRGSNARRNEGFAMNNAKVQYYARIAQEIVGNVPRIHIVDVWNMFLASPFRCNVHYPDVAIRQLLLLFVGIACQD